MQPSKILKAYYCQLGGSIDVGLLSEHPQKNQPYCSLGSSIKWRCCPPYVDHFLQHLVEQIDP